MIPGQSTDVSHTVEDSEHGETNTWDPQHTGTLNRERQTDRLLPWKQKGKPDHTNGYSETRQEVTKETETKNHKTVTMDTDKKTRQFVAIEKESKDR